MRTNLEGIYAAGDCIEIPNRITGKNADGTVAYEGGITFWRLMVGLPKPLWQREVARQARGAVESLGFMSEDHHRVRDFAVREPHLLPGQLPQIINKLCSQCFHRHT